MNIRGRGSLLVLTVTSSLRTDHWKRKVGAKTRTYGKALPFQELRGQKENERIIEESSDEVLLVTLKRTLEREAPIEWLWSRR